MSTDQEIYDQRLRQWREDSSGMIPHPRYLLRKGYLKGVVVPEPPPNQIIKDSSSEFLALFAVLGFLGIIMICIAAWVKSW